ncbi:hypothetical protein KJ840_02080 [Patescibacteria group bacterium]|nr:hypothetical protein [Patescibacteria group bacterium]
MKKDNRKYIPWLIFVTSFLFISIFTNAYLTSANEASRVATIIALEQTGEFKLNGQKYISEDFEKFNFSYSWDIIEKNGNYFSDKLPVFTILGFVIKKLIPYNFPELPRDFSLAYYFLTLFTVGICYSFLLVYFYKSARLVGVNYKLGALATLLLGLGTIILPFSTVFANHVPAALFLYLGFYFYLKDIKLKQRHKSHLFLIGFFITLAAVVEITIGTIFWLLFFIFLISKKDKGIILFLLGGLPWIVLHLYFNYKITGDFLPALLHFNWHPNPAYNPLLDSFLGRVSYLFTLTISPLKGFIFYNPLVLYCFYAIYKIIKRKLFFYKESIGLLICFLLPFFIWWFFTYDASGASYGLRWVIPYLPLFFFFLTVYFRDSKFKYQNLLIISVISVFIALVGLINPWTTEIRALNLKFDFPLLGNLFLIKSYFL